MPSITLDTTVARRDGLLAAELDNETVLLGVEQGAYFGLETTAQAIWQELAQPRQIAEIVAALTARYDIDQARCAAQTLAFVEQLAAEGLVQIETDSPR